jgi:hypothetical protein
MQPYIIDYDGPGRPLFDTVSYERSASIIKILGEYKYGE